MAKAPDNAGGRRALRDFIRIGGPAILIAVLGFVLAYQFVGPAPPDRLVIATGGRDGAYYAFASRYREVFARERIDLVVRETRGSVENLALLADPASGVQIAFVQGGTGSAMSRPDLVSLGSLYLEPLWLFVRLPGPIDGLGALAGRRIAVGAPGSGTRSVALALLRENGITGETAALVDISGSEAAAALAAGAVDAVFYVGSGDAPAVGRLIGIAGVRLVSFRRAAAYARRLRYLSMVTLPEGVLDFAANIPDRDTTLLAPAATLVASRALHPALVQLFMRAATETHRDGGLFEELGAFPSLRFTDFPIDANARRFIANGPPFLQRFLPFWAADLLDRLKIMLLPLITLLYPLFKILPPAYKWRMQTRITRWYQELQAIELRMDAGGAAARMAHLDALDRIENEVRQISVPASYFDRIYALRYHIRLVRARLDAEAASG